jgi:hypothetical protein
MAAFGLLSALSAQAAIINIPSLPFAITATGTYVVTGNLTFPVTTNVAAITISTAIQGPVIVDLKGFTFTGAAGDSIGVGIGLFAGTNGPNSYPNHRQERIAHKLWLWCVGRGVQLRPNVGYYGQQFDHSSGAYRSVRQWSWRFV